MIDIQFLYAASHSCLLLLHLKDFYTNILVIGIMSKNMLLEHIRKQSNVNN